MHTLAQMLSAVLVTAFFFFQTAIAHADGLFSATVTQCTDGDTLVLDTGQRVRLAGVDTPEKGSKDTPPQYYAREARASPASGHGNSGSRSSRFPGHPEIGIKGLSRKSSFPTGVPSMNSFSSRAWLLFTRTRTSPASWYAA